MKNWTYISLLSLLTVITACTADSGDDDTPVELTITAAVDTGTVTRANQILPGGYFDGGTQVGVYVTEQDDETAVKQHNACYTAFDENIVQKWIAESRLILKDEQLKAMAYFPYDDSESFDVTNIPLSCPNDGTDIDNLYAEWKNNISKARPNVRFILKHIKAKIRLHVSVSSLTAFYETTTHQPVWTSAAIEGSCYATAGHYNAQTGALVTTATAPLSCSVPEGFQLEKYYSTYYGDCEFLVLPVSTAGTLTLRLVIDGKPVKYELSDVQLQSGYTTVISLNLDESLLRLSSQVLREAWNYGSLVYVYNTSGNMAPTNPNDN